MLEPGKLLTLQMSHGMAAVPAAELRTSVATTLQQLKFGMFIFTRMAHPSENNHKDSLICCI